MLVVVGGVDTFRFGRHTVSCVVRGVSNARLYVCGRVTCDVHARSNVQLHTENLAVGLASGTGYVEKRGLAKQSCLSAFHYKKHVRIPMSQGSIFCDGAHTAATRSEASPFASSVST